MGQKCYQINTINKNVLNTTRLQWNDFESSSLPILIPYLEFNIDIESNSLIYKPNKAIRDKVFPVKVGKFSVFLISAYISKWSTKR